MQNLSCNLQNSFEHSINLEREKWLQLWRVEKLLWVIEWSRTIKSLTQKICINSPSESLTFEMFTQQLYQTTVERMNHNENAWERNSKIWDNKKEEWMDVRLALNLPHFMALEFDLPLQVEWMKMTYSLLMLTSVYWASKSFLWMGVKRTDKVNKRINR